MKYQCVHSHVNSSVAAFSLYHLVQVCMEGIPALIVFIIRNTHRGSVELVCVMLLVGIIIIIYITIYLEDSVVRVWSLLMYNS